MLKLLLCIPSALLGICLPYAVAYWIEHADDDD